jgi:hypothetical protein
MAETDLQHFLKGRRRAQLQIEDFGFEIGTAAVL